MITYRREVDVTKRASMEEFLKNHFRYDTAASWNNSTSYANNVKLYNLGLGRETEDKLWEMTETAEYWQELDDITKDFAIRHNYKWQAFFNGHSSGYVVLYQGELRDSGYKSFCRYCGQQNFQEATEENCRCGKCGKDGRVNYTERPTTAVVFPGRSTDPEGDFTDWSDERLKERVELVQDFDGLCDELLHAAVEMAESCDVAEEEYYVPQKRKVLNRHG